MLVCYSTETLNLLRKLVGYPRPVYVWILLLCHRTLTCITHESSSRKEQVTHANLLPKAHVLSGQSTSGKQACVFLASDGARKGLSLLTWEGGYYFSITYFPEQANK